jgi:hypothetical protein
MRDTNNTRLQDVPKIQRDIHVDRLTLVDRRRSQIEVVALVEGENFEVRVGRRHELVVVPAGLAAEREVGTLERDIKSVSGMCPYGLSHHLRLSGPLELVLLLSVGL